MDIFLTDVVFLALTRLHQNFEMRKGGMDTGERERRIHFETVKIPRIFDHLSRMRSMRFGGHMLL